MPLLLRLFAAISLIDFTRSQGFYGFPSFPMPPYRMTESGGNMQGPQQPMAGGMGGAMPMAGGMPSMQAPNRMPPKLPSLLFSCAGTSYNRLTHICCGGNVTPDPSPLVTRCCHGKPFNPSTQTCQSNVNPTGESASEAKIDKVTMELEARPMNAFNLEVKTTTTTSTTTTTPKPGIIRLHTPPPIRITRQPDPVTAPPDFKPQPVKPQTAYKFEQVMAPSPATDDTKMDPTLTIHQEEMNSGVYIRHQAASPAQRPWGSAGLPLPPVAQDEDDETTELNPMCLHAMTAMGIVPSETMGCCGHLPYDRSKYDCVMPEGGAHTTPVPVQSGNGFGFMHGGYPYPFRPFPQPPPVTTTAAPSSSSNSAAAGGMLNGHAYAPVRYPPYPYAPLPSVPPTTPSPLPSQMGGYGYVGYGPLPLMLGPGPGQVGQAAGAGAAVTTTAAPSTTKRAMPPMGGYGGYGYYHEPPSTTSKPATTVAKTQERQYGMFEHGGYAYRANPHVNPVSTTKAPTTKRPMPPMVGYGGYGYHHQPEPQPTTTLKPTTTVAETPQHVYGIYEDGGYGYMPHPPRSPAPTSAPPTKTPQHVYGIYEHGGYGYMPHPPRSPAPTAAPTTKAWPLVPPQWPYGGHYPPWYPPYGPPTAPTTPPTTPAPTSVTDSLAGDSVITKFYCEGNEFTVKENAESFRCCGKQLYDTTKYFCEKINPSTTTVAPPTTTGAPVLSSVRIDCDGLVYEVDPSSSNFYDCCGKTLFDTRKNFCQRVDLPTAVSQLNCDGNIFEFKNATEAAPYKCCGSQLYDSTKFECNTNRPAPPTPTIVFPSPDLLTRHGSGRHGHGGFRPDVPRFVTCEGQRWRVADGNPNVRCCGSYVFDALTERCNLEEGASSDIVQTPLAVPAPTQTKCGGVVLEGDNQRCCYDKPYLSPRQVCCGAAIYQRSETAGCCQVTQSWMSNERCRQLTPASSRRRK